MARALIEAGRIEIRGATVRFKQKATLTAFDRNLAALEGARVRTTPLPAARLFADFDFAGEVFRCWQDQTLVNYRDFLERVDFSGIDNFRALVRYVTKALPDDKHDLATREFAGGKPAERFATREELEAYDAAVTSGAELPKTERAPAPAAGTELERRAAAEQAWKKFAVDLAQTRAERPRGNPEIAGAVLAAMGIVMMGLTILALAKVMREPEKYPHMGAAVGIGMMLSIGLLVGSGVYFYRARKPSD